MLYRMTRKSGHFQLALGGALKRALRFGEAVREEIAVRKIGIRKRKVGIRRDCLLGMRQSLVQIGLSREWKGPPTNPAALGSDSARIGLKPQLEGLVRLFQISRHMPVVGKVDEELFPIADTIPQLPGSCRALG